MDKLISIVVLLLVAAGMFYVIAGKDLSLRSSSERNYQIVVDETAAQKIP